MLSRVTAGLSEDERHRIVQAALLKRGAKVIGKTNDMLTVSMMRHECLTAVATLEALGVIPSSSWWDMDDRWAYPMGAN